MIRKSLSESVTCPGMGGREFKDSLYIFLGKFQRKEKLVHKWLPDAVKCIQEVIIISIYQRVNKFRRTKVYEISPAEKWTKLALQLEIEQFSRRASHTCKVVRFVVPLFCTHSSWQKSMEVMLSFHMWYTYLYIPPRRVITSESINGGQ